MTEVLPDAPRTEITRRIRRVSDRLSAGLPATVPGGWPPGFSTIAPLLLARIAGEGRTIATLIGRGHELDAQMVVRSMLEHVTLVAWLAIQPATPGPEDAADRQPRTPEEKTRWWVADQCRRDQRDLEDYQKLIRDLDADVRANIKAVKTEMRDELGWGELPRLRPMAKDVDAAWGGKLSGWARAEPREAAFPFTVQGLYLTLYSAGNRSTHPSLGQLMHTFLERTPEDAPQARVMAEPLIDRVSPIVSISAFLLLYACGIAEHLYGGPVLDDALRDLDRYDVVRGPGLLLKQVGEVLDGEPARKFGTSGALPVRVEKSGETTTVVVITHDGWERFVHAPGPMWTYDDSQGVVVQAGRLEFDDAAGARIARFRERLRIASWERLADDWPDSAP